MSGGSDGRFPSLTELAVKFIKQAFYRFEYGDDYWLDRAVSEVSGLSASDCSEIEFPDRGLALEFVWLVLRKYAELTPVAGTLGPAFSSSRDREKAYDQIGGLRTADVCDTRFVGDPSISDLGPGGVVLRRKSETRIGRHVNTVKTIVFEGEEFTRTVLEEKWSDWYPSVPEIVTISVLEFHRRWVAVPEPAGGNNSSKFPPGSLPNQPSPN